MIIDDNLLEDVKGYLDISWELSDGEVKKLTGMIARGMKTLEDKIGNCDFSQETQEKALLLNYVMYDRAGSLADFWGNYKGEIISLRMRNKVKVYEKENTDNKTENENKMNPKTEDKINVAITIFVLSSIGMIIVAFLDYREKRNIE